VPSTTRGARKDGHDSPGKGGEYAGGLAAERKEKLCLSPNSARRSVRGKGALNTKKKSCKKQTAEIDRKKKGVALDLCRSSKEKKNHGGEVLHPNGKKGKKRLRRLKDRPILHYRGKEGIMSKGNQRTKKTKQRIQYRAS